MFHNCITLLIKHLYHFKIITKREDTLKYIHDTAWVRIHLLVKEKEGFSFTKENIHTIIAVPTLILGRK